MSLESVIQSSFACLTNAIYAIKGSLVSPSAAGTTATSVETSTGTVTAGAVYISFENTGSADVTVDGATLKPDKVLCYPTSVGMTLPAVTYDASAGELTIAAVYPPA